MSIKPLRNKAMSAKTMMTKPKPTNTKAGKDTSSGEHGHCCSDLPFGSVMSNHSSTESNPEKPRFRTSKDSKPTGLRDKATGLVSFFGGECLSLSKLSIVKGAEAFKFKCNNGHIFYKFATELQQLRLPFNRRHSKTTASSVSSVSSDEEMMLGTWRDSNPLSGVWCPKCESFFKSAELIAKNCGFKLCGDLYSNNLVLRCLKAKHHTTPISYKHRLQANMKCAGCRKEEREAVKQRLREEERIQNEYYAKMQEQMFAQARLDMEKELAAGAPFGFVPTAESAFMDENARQ